MSDRMLFPVVTLFTVIIILAILKGNTTLTPFHVLLIEAELWYCYSGGGKKLYLHEAVYSGEVLLLSSDRVVVSDMCVCNSFILCIQSPGVL